MIVEAKGTKIIFTHSVKIQNEPMLVELSLNIGVKVHLTTIFFISLNECASFLMYFGKQIF